jgi:tripartite-type tricarboxylate transporter receptor subunit TctC
MVVDPPGSSDSIYAMQLVDVAKKMSPVPIKIEHREDFSSFGTWEAIAWTMDQGEVGNEGYIPIIAGAPGTIIDLIVIDMKKEVGVDLNDYIPVVFTETIRYLIHQRADAPWGNTMQDFIAYAKKNPGKLRYISGGGAGGQNAAMQWYMSKFGFTVKEILGGGSGERALAVAAGEGDFTLSPADVVLPHWQAKKVKVLMVSGPEKPPAPWEDVPTAIDLGLKDDPHGMSRGIIVSAKVPESHRAWLETLFTASVKDKEYMTNRQKIPGITLKTLNKEASDKLVRDAYDFMLPIFKKMGLFWGDKKK